MPKTSTTIPAFAGRLSAFLASKGISKDNRFVLDSPVHLMQVIDMPGVLDFAEPTVNAIYPEDGTVVLVTENGSLCQVTDQDDDYGDGNHISTHWNLKELKAIFEPLDETLNQTKHLCKRLSEAVPVGTLVLPEDTKVSFLDADDNHRWFDLLSVTTEKGQALVTYRDGGTTFTDYARDLSPEDIREVLKAVGH